MDHRTQRRRDLNCETIIAAVERAIARHGGPAQGRRGHRDRVRHTLRHQVRTARTVAQTREEAWRQEGGTLGAATGSARDLTPRARARSIVSGDALSQPEPTDC